MAVTDLTGTKWEFNDNLTLDFEREFAIDFKSDTQTFDTLYVGYGNEYDDGLTYGALGYIKIYAYSRSGSSYAWLTNYKTIEITGGTDATNANLISWLEENATQIIEPTITDLTGTRWQLNAVPEVNNKRYSVYGGVYVGGQGIEGFTTITKSFSGATGSVTFSNGGTQSSASVFYGTGSTYQGWYHKTKGASVSSGATFTPLATAPIIKFTRGTDVTNANLISWLQANATQIIEPAKTLSLGNLTIENVYFGSRQVKKVYMGNTLVWESATKPVPDNALLAQDGALLTTDGGYLITTEITLITFMIYGTTYQAEDGMTWQEWCASTYNTAGYKVVGDHIYNQTETFYVSFEGGNVTPSNTITASYNYGHTGGSGN